MAGHSFLTDLCYYCLPDGDLPACAVRQDNLSYAAVLATWKLELTCFFVQLAWEGCEHMRAWTEPSVHSFSCEYPIANGAQSGSILEQELAHMISTGVATFGSDDICVIRRAKRLRSMQGSRHWWAGTL